MISKEDVLASHAQAATFDEGALEHWVAVANVAIHPERVKDQRTLEMSRVNFVMHQMTKPAMNLAAPHVVARSRQMGRRAGYIRAPHPWAGTSHGENLIKAVKF